MIIEKEKTIPGYYQMKSFLSHTYMFISFTLYVYSATIWPDIIVIIIFISYNIIVDVKLRCGYHTSYLGIREVYILYDVMRQSL